MPQTTQSEILHFWFTELTPQQHFIKDAALDESIRTRFRPTLEAAARCELFPWRATPEGRLAEILVLDQFSRNVYRDTPRAFAQDALALALAQELVASERAGPQPAHGAARVCLHAAHAQRIGGDPRASPGAVCAAGHGKQPGL